jgi:hypothetical protein
MANSAQKDLDKLLVTQGVSRKSIANKRDAAQLRAITTDVLIGTAAAAAVAGTLTWIIGHEKAEKPENKKGPVAGLRMDVGLGSLGVSGKF